MNDAGRVAGGQGTVLTGLLSTELGSAAQSARDVQTRIRLVQKIVMDVPEAVTVDDVTVLYEAFRAAEALQHMLDELRARLDYGDAARWNPALPSVTSKR